MNPSRRGLHIIHPIGFILSRIYNGFCDSISPEHRLIVYYFIIMCLKSLSQMKRRSYPTNWYYNLLLEGVQSADECLQWPAPGNDNKKSLNSVLLWDRRREYRIRLTPLNIVVQSV